MKMVRIVRALFLTLGMIVLGTTAEAVDMTGTWEGKERCGCFDEAGGKSTTRYNREVMKVTQDGTDLNIEAFGELFNGNVIDHPRSSSKGEASLIACRTDPTDNASFGEIGRAKVWARDGGRGRMIVESLWNPQGSEICTCKGNFRRTATTDPEVDDCSDAAEAAAMDRWHLAMIDSTPADAGCYEADYPDGWGAVDCAETSSKRSLSAGGGASWQPKPERNNDWVVRVKGNDKSQKMLQVTGSFPTVTNVTSINSTNGTIMSPDNIYSIQLNTQFYPLSPGEPGYTTCGKGCTAWQQFFYWSEGTNDSGKLDIQYWLGRTTQPCPSDEWNTLCHVENLPDGDPCPVGASRSCMMDVEGEKYIGVLPITSLDKVRLTGKAGADNDTVIIRADGVSGFSSTVHAYQEIRTTDATASLANHWRQAEFNIFGLDTAYPNAVFNDPPPGEQTELEVQIAVESLDCDGQGGGSCTLVCVPSYTQEALPGETAEYNNLTFTDKCQPVRSGSNTFRFTQGKQ